MGDGLDKAELVEKVLEEIFERWNSWSSPEFIESPSPIVHEPFEEFAKLIETRKDTLRRFFLVLEVVHLQAGLGLIDGPPEIMNS